MIFAMTHAPTADTRRHGPWAVLGLVGAILLLLIGIGLSILTWQPRTGFIYPAAIFIAALGLAAVISALTRLARRSARTMIIRTGAVAVVAGLIMTLAAPAVVRQVDLRGHGLRWQSSLAGPLSSSDFDPKASVGDALLLQDSSGIVVVGLPDGAVRGKARAGQSAEITPADDHFVVEDDHRYQLYDTAGAPTWPASIEADEVLARQAGVTVLWQCGDDRCTITGYADSGRPVWQLPGPRGGGLYFPTERYGDPRGVTTLPDRFALRQRSGYGWRVIDAATGKPLGTETGHAAHLATGATVALRFGGRAGTCQLIIDAKARGGRTVHDILCRDPAATFIRGRMLVVPVGDTAAHLYPLDQDAGPIEVESAERLLSQDYPPLADDTGMAGLANGRVEGWAWPRAGVSTGPARWARDHPRIETDPDLDHLTVRAGTVVVAGAADGGSPYDEREDSWVAVYDLATGAETARVRVPAEENYPIRYSEVLPIGPGCAAAVADGTELLLLGTC